MQSSGCCYVGKFLVLLSDHSWRWWYWLQILKSKIKTGYSPHMCVPLCSPFYFREWVPLELCRFLSGMCSSPQGTCKYHRKGHQRHHYLQPRCTLCVHYRGCRQYSLNLMRNIQLSGCCYGGRFLVQLSDHSWRWWCWAQIQMGKIEREGFPHISSQLFWNIIKPTNYISTWPLPHGPIQ